MRTSRRSAALGLALGMLSLAAMTGPAAAGQPDRYRWSDTFTVGHECGIVETTTMTVNEKAFWEGGTWVRSVIHFTFTGVFDGPDGASLAAQTNQSAIFAPDRNQTSGQGSFLRGVGGVLLHDTGHLVFDPSDGTTLLASAMVLRWDDPAFPGVLEEALCARLG